MSQRVKNVILSIDLNGLGSDPRGKRDDFEKELKERKVFKVASVTTVWKFSYKETEDAIAAYKCAINDVGSSALAAGISDWDAVVQAGDNKPLVFDSSNWKTALTELSKGRTSSLEA